MPLDLNVDEVVTRQELNATFGGGIQGGMLTPAGGRYIFLFSDPVPGDLYGYTWDGWENKDLHTFFYTGEGAVGDQEFTRRNRILRDSLKEHREVHMFVADGYRDGTRERTHRYMGQFSVDSDQPWRREDAVDSTGATRSVIVFRLHREGGSTQPRTHTESYTPEVAASSRAEMIDPEASNANEFSRAAQAETTAVRRERTLEDAFQRHLAAAGGKPGRLKITLKGQAKPLFTDTWDAASRELYEAKGSVTRNDIRLAIGQLLDYRRHITPPPTRCTILLPTDPGEDLTDLIHDAGMDVVYQDGSSFTRVSAASRMTAGPAAVGAGVERNDIDAAIRLAAKSFPTPASPRARLRHEQPAAAQRISSGPVPGRRATPDRGI